MRRYQVMIESAFPSEAGTMLKNLEKKGNPWGLAKKQRLEWTKEVDFEVPVVGQDLEDLGEVDYLYWVGCAGCPGGPGEEDHQGVRRTAAHRGREVRDHGRRREVHR